MKLGEVTVSKISEGVAVREYLKVGRAYLVCDASAPDAELDEACALLQRCGYVFDRKTDKRTELWGEAGEDVVRFDRRPDFLGYVLIRKHAHAFALTNGEVHLFTDPRQSREGWRKSLDRLAKDGLGGDMSFLTPDHVVITPTMEPC